MILTVTLNAAVDSTYFVEGLNLHGTNRVLRIETDAGGKGINVARVAAQLSESGVVATGFLGGTAGGYVLGVLDREGVVGRFHWVASETRTNASIEDGSGEPPTSLNVKGGEIQTQEWERFLIHFAELAAIADWAVLGGSLAPGLPAEAYAILTHIAKEQGAKVLVDADGEPLRHAMTARPHFIKPNEDEVSRFLGVEVRTEEECLYAAKGLLRFLEPEGIVVISRGADGAVMANSEGSWVGETPRVEPVSTIGSGDSMIGGMLAAIERGDTWPTALQWGLAAGAATASTNGSEIGQRDVMELLFDDAKVRRAAE